jgi:nitroreductase
MACIYCGHCFAICPEQAIAFEFGAGAMEEKPAGVGVSDDAAGTAFTGSGAEEEKSAGSKAATDGLIFVGSGAEEMAAPGRAISYPGGMPDADTISDFLFSARADRLYSDKAVEKEKIEKVVEAMMRAPSGGNEQNKRYYVFTDGAKLAEIEKMQKEYFHRLLQKFNSPAARRMAALSVTMSAKNKEIPFKALYKQNLEIISSGSFFDNSAVSYLKGGKALIVITYEGKSGMHKSFYKGDVRIAGTYGILMAKALGLASCWMGLLEIAMGKDRKIGEFMKIGEKEKVGGALILGYSGTKWVSCPPRGPAKITWQ